MGMLGKWAIPVFASILIFGFSYPLDTQTADADVQCNSNSDCDDSDACTRNICDDVLHGSFPIFRQEDHCRDPIPRSGNACDDGNACTTSGTCSAGQCVSSLVPINCNDGNPCTDDSCNLATGCVNAWRTAVGSRIPPKINIAPAY